LARKGIYFWEFGPNRAREWAEQKQRKGEIKEVAVIGAVVHLGNCFDLFDREATELLASAYPVIKEAFEA
jgi:hypothetical protein